VGEKGTREIQEKGAEGTGPVKGRSTLDKGNPRGKLDMVIDGEKREAH